MSVRHDDGGRKVLGQLPLLQVEYGKGVEFDTFPHHLRLVLYAVVVVRGGVTDQSGRVFVLACKKCDQVRPLASLDGPKTPANENNESQQRIQV